MENSSDNEEKQNLLSLRKCLKKEQYNKAIDLCNHIIAKNPADIDIYRVKISCLVNLKRFDEAIKIAEDSNEFTFERAYCLYRKNKLDEVIELCESFSEPRPEKVINLEAQAYYKLQQYTQATACYERLVDLSSDPDYDLLANIYATHVSSGCGQSALSSHPLDESSVGDSFELMYNIACAYISTGNYSKAEETLEQAKAMCVRVLEEDGASGSIIEEECAAINLQKTFVDIICHRASEQSLQECRAILRNHKKDNELYAVAANNLAVLRGDTDLPDSLRRLRNTISAASEDKLTKSQLMEIRYNRCLLLLHLKKVDECMKNLEELDKIYGPNPRSILIRACTFALTKDYTQSDHFVNENISLIDSSEDPSGLCEKLILVKAQTLIDRKQFKEAFEIMSSVSSLRQTAAGVSAMYNLQTIMSKTNSVDTNSATDFLLKCAKEITDTDDTTDAQIHTLRSIAHEFQSKHLYSEAAQVWRYLLQCASAIDSSDRLTATAQLAVCLSHCDVEESGRIAVSLPQVDAEGVNAEELEKSEIPLLSKRVNTSNSHSHSQDAGTTTEMPTEASKKERAEEMRRARLQRRKAKCREEYLKKLEEAGKYDPNKPVKPDPERWVPLKHRSYNKRGRRNRNKFVGGQGSGDGAAKDMLKLDAYARANASDSASKKPKGTVVESSSAKNKGRKKR